MTTPPKKTVAMGVTAVIIAVLPALFTYLENRHEIQAKYSQTQHAASSGYDALAASVKELQAATLAQHDYIVKMQAQLEMMQEFVIERTRRSASTVVATRPGVPQPVTVIEPDLTPPPLPAPPHSPAYGKVPKDFAAAQRPAGPMD